MSENTAAPPPRTMSLTVPGGRIAYDVQGQGPLVLMLPGMGDLRSSFRFLVPQVVAAGYRVVTADLRGHGESTAGFDSYGDEATAADLGALLEHLGEPAVVVGNSMAAGSAVIVAADRPESVRALVLIGPFVRNPGHVSLVQRGLLRVLMGGPWAPAMWNAYLPTLYRGRKPEDFEEYRKLVRSALRRPGYAEAFRRTTRTDHQPAEEALGSVRAPTLVVMGDRDPDFPDPAAEAAWVADAVGGQVRMIDDAGHYPHAQQPRATADAVIDFLHRVDARD